MLANMKGLLLGMALAATIPTLDKASAQSIETGTGLLCDQPSEVERFFSLLEDDLQTAIEQVNAEAHKASACAVVQVAFVKGSEVAAGRHKNGSYRVVEVVVVVAPPVSVVVVVEVVEVVVGSGSVVSGTTDFWSGATTTFPYGSPTFVGCGVGTVNCHCCASISVSTSGDAALSVSLLKK